MTDFEKALAQAKKFAEKNENQITETEFEAITDSYKIEPDEMRTAALRSAILTLITTIQI